MFKIFIISVILVCFCLVHSKNIEDKQFDFTEFFKLVMEQNLTEALNYAKNSDDSSLSPDYQNMKKQLLQVYDERFITKNEN
jgi:hypothetical protein